MKILSENRRARFDYHIESVFECGISLMGTEVKSIRSGLANLIDSFCYLSDSGCWLKGMYVPTASNAFQHDPIRDRQLLIKKTEINRLRKGSIDGLSIIPLRVYQTKNWIKIDISLAKGKKAWDKRQSIRDREEKREIKTITG